MASPLAGLDHGAALDTGPVTAALEARLADDRALWRLPAKWSMVVDDGGDPPLSDIAADVRFEAAADGTMRVGLADDPLRAVCAAAEVPEVTAALAAFALVGKSCRMDALVRERGAGALFAAAGLAFSREMRVASAPVAARDLVGMRRFGAASVLGLAPVFGGLRAEHLLALVAEARRWSVADVRLTPWRVLLLTGVSRPAGAAIAGASLPPSFIAAPDDPRLAIAACSGRPACHRASTPVRTHAAALATWRLPALDRGEIHVSGCAKGCAHPGPADWTLVGRDGRYDLVRDGRAGDVPLVRGLTFEDAARRLGHELAAP